MLCSYLCTHENCISDFVLVIRNIAEMVEYNCTLVGNTGNTTRGYVNLFYLVLASLNFMMNVRNATTPAPYFPYDNILRRFVGLAWIELQCKAREGVGCFSLQRSSFFTSR
jgi:hypothetical protein